MPRRYYLTIVLATLAGAFLRLWQLTMIPPGLHYDLAATALLGNEVAFNGYRPIFIQAYTGHEPLFYYWLAAWFNLIGSSIFSLRLAAAFLGVLTIPATFFAIAEFMRLFMPGDRVGPYTLAALAAGLLAFAFFHLVFSRFGFRVITQPLVQSLALGFLCRGLYRISDPELLSEGDWRLQSRDFILAGFFTGLAAYTYLSARLFPFPLAVLWLAVFAAVWRWRRGQGAGHQTHALRVIGAKPRIPLPSALAGYFLLFVLSAALTFAPLGLYFVRHPEDFLNRAAQIVARPGDEGLLWQGFRRAAEMVFLDGEPYDRFNLPGLPLFPLPLGVFFAIGLFLVLLTAFGAPPAAIGGRRSGFNLQRPASLLALAWLLFMLLPTALSVHDIFPSNVRAFGLTPLVFVFPALGLAATYRWVQQRWPGPLIGTAYPFTIITLVILAAGTSATYRLYFFEWANLRSQRLNNDADLTGLSAYLNTQSLAETSAYVSAIHYRHPTVAYLAREYGAVRWLTGGSSLALPRNRSALIVSAASAPLPEAWTTNWRPYLVFEQLGPDNRPEFSVYRFAAGQSPPLPAFAALEVNFGNVLFATGYRATRDGEQLLVDVRWRVENAAPADDYLPYVRLYDSLGRQWTQSDNFTYPSEQWVAGDTLITRHKLRLPPGLPPDDYVVKVGLYSQSTDAGLARLNAQGGFGGERATLGRESLAYREASAEALRRAYAPQQPVTSTLAPLLGYTLTAPSLRPNQRFELTLYWHTVAPLQAPLTIGLGERVLWRGMVTVSGALAQRLTLRLPQDWPAGPFDLTLSVDGAGEAALTVVEVLAVQRAFALPEAASRVGAALSGAASKADIRLAGYELQPGPTTRLKLYWQSTTPVLDADYTVFVHVLDAVGQIVAQADALPRGGAWPTSLWVQNEVIADDYAFDLPPGDYALAVGLYDAETGDRLRAGATDHVLLPAFRVP